MTRTLGERAYRRARSSFRILASARFAERVVVFESDDWGLARSPAERLTDYGEPGPWSDERSEGAEDLALLYDTLRCARDGRGRPACFTANFVMANPDVDAVAASSFTVFSERLLGETAPADQLAAYRRGVDARVFWPQLHGRRHFAVGPWLDDLRADRLGARALARTGGGAGLAQLRGSGWRYHSEYVDWSAGRVRSSEDVEGDLREAMSHFERVFGFAPRSTIAPHYVVTDAAVAAWRRLGLRYVQGGSYQLRPSGSRDPEIVSYPLGAARAGLIWLSRTARFEPRPGRGQGWEHALAAADHLFRRGLPVVIDTHRINYTGRYRDAALDELRRLLDTLSRRGAVFLTTTELGEAVERGGAFRDAFSGEPRRLRPIGVFVRRVARLAERLRST